MTLMIPKKDFEQLLSTLPPDRRRLAELGARVWDGDARVRWILEVLADFHRCEDILRYLVKEGLTGKKLWEWVQGEHDGSVLRMASFVIMKLKRNAEPEPLYVGRDVRRPRGQG